MSLLSIPAELRIQIYEYLPELQHRHETISCYSKLTPPICQVNRTIRHETVPLIASNSSFLIDIDGPPTFWNSRISTWLAALGPQSVSRVRSLQISRHWQIPLPMRGQGHVGFYVRLEQRKPRRLTSKSSVKSTSSFKPEWNDRFVLPMSEGMWEVTTGTYPFARDMRGMRLDSVEILAEVVRHHLHVPTPVDREAASTGDIDRAGLTTGNVVFLARAIEIVASHPVSTFDLEQGQEGRKRRHMTWTNMEQQLRELSAQSMATATMVDDPDVPSLRRFLTTY
ncbi:hypothetical protein CLAFUW4_07512 [Fulvia fulva]|uniref:F-box domain-containing protein n=1 Tax=Passalora fulva TaxID=5499 RepID=A0A9Q8PAG9_PASFU|nr:uncharacterized protein CLAFUR5_07642 [Fulvia fulva]KAK4623326.1 hypothetical protein CLAFUR0_07518 [Fulvia fulva]UJO18877.1 hypothetical protein CLAFUR5_07642 [Fulvia fulva]WPV16159.1 hypothetical protein CLAFUW4_07512 [Fulvia fulva]WPV31532.1 hypothetical protein CLAFUW7_07514 [Fulvia fulva]